MFNYFAKYLPSLIFLAALCHPNKSIAEVTFNPRIGPAGAIVSAAMPFAGTGFLWMQSDLMINTTGMFNIGIAYEYIWREGGTQKEADSRHGGAVNGWYRRHFIAPRIELNLLEAGPGAIYLAGSPAYASWSGQRDERYTSGPQVCHFIRSGNGSYVSTKVMAGYLYLPSPFSVNVGAGAVGDSTIRGKSYSVSDSCNSAGSSASAKDKKNPRIQPLLEIYVGLLI